MHFLDRGGHAGAGVFPVPKLTSVAVAAGVCSIPARENHVKICEERYCNAYLSHSR